MPKQNLSFLNNLGEGKDQEPLQLDASQKALIELAAEFAENAKNNLNKADRTATGFLLDSIIPLEPQISGNKVTVEVEVAEYYKFVNKGVKGLKGGSGLYSFKYANPSKKMVAAIQAWVTKERIKFTDKSKNKVAINSRERKRKAASPNSTAYIIARSIKKKGLKPTGFWDKAVETLEQSVVDKLGDAAKIDIINSF